jgi:N-acyl-D-amino-acid deacylase
MKERQFNSSPRVYRSGSRRRFPRRIAILVAVVVGIGVILGAGLLWAKRRLTEQFDLLIVNGSVVDGTGASAQEMTIGIRGGKVVPVSWPYFAEADRTISARGLIVAPGFIDVHTHIEANVVGNRKSPLLAPNFIAQGTTTIITGNCGRSALSLSGFFQQLESRGVQINIGSLVGHNTIRREVMKEASRAPTEDELRRMCQLVARAMRDGAMGLSTGLEYIPGVFAGENEIEALAVIAAQYHGIYATHMRDEGNGAISSLREALSVARRAQIPLQISHLKWRGRVNWGKSQRLIDMIAEARNAGLYVRCDAYPYTASSTTLDVLIPKEAREGGKLRERLRDPAEHQHILTGILDQMKSEGWRDFSFARVAYCDFAPEFNGLTITEVASWLSGTKKLATKVSTSNGSLASPTRVKHNVQSNQGGLDVDGPSAASQAEAICYLASRGSVQMVFENMNEDDVSNILMFSECMLGSDSNIRNGEGRPHPRGYGSAPRLLSLFSKERGLFSSEEAIRRMTSLPAETFGIVNRGRLQPGYWADAVIFDPAQIKDQATHENPFRTPDGIVYVVVNGQVALDRGEPGSLNAGQVLKRNF